MADSAIIRVVIGLFHRIYLVLLFRDFHFVSAIVSAMCNHLWDCFL